MGRDKNILSALIDLAPNDCLRGSNWHQNLDMHVTITGRARVGCDATALAVYTRR